MRAAAHSVGNRSVWKAEGRARSPRGLNSKHPMFRDMNPLLRKNFQHILNKIGIFFSSFNFLNKMLNNQPTSLFQTDMRKSHTLFYPINLHGGFCQLAGWTSPLSHTQHSLPLHTAPVIKENRSWVKEEIPPKNGISQFWTLPFGVDKAPLCCRKGIHFQRAGLSQGDGIAHWKIYAVSLKWYTLFFFLRTNGLANLFCSVFGSSLTELLILPHCNDE